MKSSKVDGPRWAMFKIVGTSPLLFGKQVFATRLDEETPQQFEERTVLGKVTVNSDNNVCLNAEAVKRSLEWASGWRNEKLPGGAGGKATFKKRFVAGVASMEPYFELCNGKKAIKPSDLRLQSLSVPAQGQRGGSKRVTRIFPTLDPEWSADCRLAILDMAIDDQVFEQHIKTAAMFDGMGAMRVGNGGPNGRYRVEDLKFEMMDI